MTQPPVLLITRRQFLQLGLGTTAALALPLLAGCEKIEKTPSGPPDIVTPAPNDNFPQPKTIASVNRLLQTTLLIKAITLGADKSPTGKQITLRMYGSPKTSVANPNPDNNADWDWGFPGPTLRVNRGDTIQLTLLNYLAVVPPAELGVCEPAYYPTPGPTPATTPAAGQPTLTPTPALNPDKFPDCYNESNVTNLHYHGLHVNQEESGDDVLLAIYPNGQDPNSVTHEHGETVLIGRNDYNFQIPDDHPQGTFWYHPHKHGATEIQVANGMAGTLIVNDTLDNDPVFAERPPVEQVLVVQKILETLPFPKGGGSGTQTINGVTNPQITMQAGEIQRWRIINATGNAAAAFQVNFTSAGAPEMFLIAVDGNFLDDAHWQAQLTQKNQTFFLAPGNRADFLVRAVQEGTFSAQSEQAFTNEQGGGGQGAQATATPTPIKTTTLLTVNVTAPLSPAMKLPATLPALPFNLRPFGSDEKDVCTRTLTFEMLGGGQGGAGKGQAPVWAINGQQFDPGRVDQCMLLNTSETWTLINTTSVAHPFHIHVNPFLIQEFVDPTPNDPDDPNTTGDNPVGQWQDTIIIPAQNGNTPGKVVIRQRFPDIAGKFVLHCHILGHEDRGMMQLLEIVDDAAKCTGGACPVP